MRRRHVPRQLRRQRGTSSRVGVRGGAAPRREVPHDAFIAVLAAVLTLAGASWLDDQRSEREAKRSEALGWRLTLASGSEFQGLDASDADLSGIYTAARPATYRVRLRRPRWPLRHDGRRRPWSCDARTGQRDEEFLRLDDLEIPGAPSRRATGDCCKIAIHRYCPIRGIWPRRRLPLETMSSPASLNSPEGKSSRRSRRMTRAAWTARGKINSVRRRPG